MSEQRTPEEWDIIYQRYMAGEKVESLIEEYNLPVKCEAYFIRVFPPVSVEDVYCPFCHENINLTKKRRAKSAKKSDGYVMECPICGHKDYSRDNRHYYKRKCQCENCLKTAKDEKIAAEASKKALVEAKRQGVLRVYGPENHKPYVVGINGGEDFFLKETLYLASLFHARMSEDMSTILPVDYKNVFLPVAPTAYLDLEIARRLTRLTKNVDGCPIWGEYRPPLLIADIQRTPLDAFISPEESEDEKYIKEGTWQHYFLGHGFHFQPNFEIYLPKGKNEKKGKFVRLDCAEAFKVVFKGLEWWRDSADDGPTSPQTWRETILPMWKELAIEEIVQYSQYICSHFNIPCDAGDKTRAVAKSLIENFSVAQSYCLAYRNARDVAAYIASNSCHRYIKKESLFSNGLLRMAEKALAQEWNIADFNRTESVPRSALSIALFDAFLRWENDQGFYLCPRKYQPPTDKTLYKREELERALKFALAYEYWHGWHNAREPENTDASKLEAMAGETAEASLKEGETAWDWKVRKLLSIVDHLSPGLNPEDEKTLLNESGKPWSA